MLNRQNHENQYFVKFVVTGRSILISFENLLSEERVVTVAGHPVYKLASRNSRNAILIPSPQIRGHDVDAPKYMWYTRWVCLRVYVRTHARGCGSCRSRWSVCVNFTAGLPVATVTITYHVCTYTGPCARCARSVCTDTRVVRASIDQASSRFV